MSDPATKQDIQELKQELKLWILEREVQFIRWFVGTQIAYFIVTLGAMVFMLQHYHP